MCLCAARKQQSRLALLPLATESLALASGEIARANALARARPDGTLHLYAQPQPERLADFVSARPVLAR